MAFTKIVAAGINTGSSYTFQDLNTVGVVTAATVQVGSATTVHTTGIDLGSGNITSHNINSTGIITATSFVGPVTGDITGNITGDITATSGTFSGNVSIGGTLTYEDVTNIDSVGIITAQAGVKVTGGQVVIGGDANNGTAEGLQLNTSGFIQASRGSGVSALWAGYTQGSSTQTSRIDNDGDAHFLGKIGVGTDNPSVKLQVLGGSGDQLWLDNAGERYTQISLRNNGTQKAALWLDETTDQFDLFAASGYGIRLLAGGSERLLISDTGKIGVGGAPAANWHSAASSNVIQVGSSVLFDFSSAQFDVGHNYYYDGSNYKYTTTGYAGRITFNKSDGSIRFWSLGTGNANANATVTEKLRLNSDGKLILSSTQRTTPFISGDGGMCIEQSYDGNLRALTIRNKDTDAAAATSLAFSLNRSGSDHDFASGEIKSVKEQTWSGVPTTVDSAMVFSTIQNENLGEKLRINSAGLVGIGTDNPTLTAGNGVHIAGGNAALKLQNTNNGDWAFIEYADESNTTKYIQGYRDSSGVYAIRPGTSLNATPGISLTSAGNIGINRTDPDQKLNVSGCAEFNAYDSASGSGGYYTSKGLIIGNLYDAGKSYSGSDDRTACIWQERGLDVDFATNDALRMKITYDGMMGLGTATPTNTHGKGLHIADTNAGIRIQNTVNTGWAYMEYADESNTVKYVQGYRDSTGLYGIRPGNSLSASTGLTINSSGIVSKPNHPSFRVSRNVSNWNVAGNTKFDWDLVVYNTGSHFSTANDRFVAPVAGTYHFDFSIIWYHQTLTNEWVSLRVNNNRVTGGDIHFSANFSASRWHNVAFSHTVYLASSDYVEIWNGGNTVNYHGSTWAQFSGYLVG